MRFIQGGKHYVPSGLPRATPGLSYQPQDLIENTDCRFVYEEAMLVSQKAWPYFWQERFHEINTIKTPSFFILSGMLSGLVALSVGILLTCSAYPVVATRLGNRQPNSH